MCGERKSEKKGITMEVFLPTGVVLDVHGLRQERRPTSSKPNPLT